MVIKLLLKLAVREQYNNNEDVTVHFVSSSYGLNSLPLNV